MTISIATSNHFKFQLGKKLVDLSADSIKAILLDNSYTFTVASDDNLSDIAADQLATGVGYTQNNKALANKAWTRDDVNNKAVMTCDDISWTAAAGNIGPFKSLALIDESAINETEFFTTAGDRIFDGGAGVSNWANQDLNAFNDDGDLSITASAVGQYCKITFTHIGTALVAGGLYRLQYDYTEGTAGFEFRINGVAEQTLGDAVAGTAQTIDFYADESFTGAHELRIYGKTNAAASGDFDNFSLKELGTVIGCATLTTAVTISDGLTHFIRDIEVEIA